MKLWHFVSSTVVSADGASASASRVCALALTLAFIVKMFWGPDAGVLGVTAGLVTSCLGLRDGSPIQGWLARHDGDHGPPPESAHAGGA